MRIGLDLTPLLPEATGVDRYLIRLVRHLAELDSHNRYTIFVNRDDRPAFAGLPQNFIVRASSLRPRPVRFVFQQVALPVAAGALGLDVLHSLSYFLPLARGRQRHLLSVHDMTSFSHPDVHTRLRRHPLYRAAIARSIRRAHLVSVPSAHVEREIYRLFPALPPNHVRVIPYGVGDEFQPAAAADAERVRRRLGLPAGYVLFVGTIEPRKNLELLIEAYCRLREGRDRHDLVIAGRLGWGYADLLELLKAPELQGHVHLLGYVDSADLPGLYAGATVLVYPSQVEGFGFPPLEAMATGTPVIASDTSSLTENLQGATELVPVGQVEALTSALHRLLGDEHARDRLRTAGLRRAADFRWERTARATLDCYEELAGRDAASAMA
jgi:glycosyltransferase involved in cell wall biosynthesis